MNYIEELKDIINKKKVLEEREKILKSQIEEEVGEDGYKDEYVTISYKQASETTSIDLKKLEEREPELYNDLLKDYEKITSRKASFSYRFNR